MNLLLNRSLVEYRAITGLISKQSSFCFTKL
jgi:hypothetical protein